VIEQHDAGPGYVPSVRIAHASRVTGVRAPCQPEEEPSEQQQANGHLCKIATHTTPGVYRCRIIRRVRKTHFNADFGER
jgi:hypothetical protein